MGAARGLGEGPWPYQGQIPHRAETLDATSGLTVQTGLRLSPIAGAGFPRDPHAGMTKWAGPTWKPMGQMNGDGTITWVDATGLNQSAQAIPPQVPMMGPSMSRRWWGGLPNGGKPTGELATGYGGRSTRKGRKR